MGRGEFLGRPERGLHEFAHQLDFEDYATNGAPVLATRAESIKWARVMNRELKRRCVPLTSEGVPTVLYLVRRDESGRILRRRDGGVF